MQKKRTVSILIFCFLYIVNNVYSQDPYVYYQCGKIQNNPNLIVNVGLQKLNPFTNEVINLGATPGGSDIAFHPDGRLFMIKDNEIFEIDTISNTYPVYPKSLIATLPPNSIMVGMTIDKEGIIWMSGKLDNKNAVCTYNLSNTAFTIVGIASEVNSNNIGVDIEWYNGELFTIGIDMPVTQNTILNKINLLDFSQSSAHSYGRQGLSYALASINNECTSVGLFAPTGFPDSNNVFTDGYFNFSLDLNSLETNENTDMGIGPQGATSRTSWLASYTPLVIDTVNVNENVLNCEKSYIITARLKKGYYMRPDIEFSLDGINFQSDSSFYNLSYGSYVIHIKDSLGCSQISDTINLKKRSFVDLHARSSSCGLNNGGLVIKNSDSTRYYKVSIDGGIFTTADSISNLAPGLHNAIIEYEEGCRDTIVFNIETQPLPDFNIIQSIMDDYCDKNTGSNIIVTSNPINVIYYSDDGIKFVKDSIEINGLIGGQYKIYLKHESGCRDTVDFEIKSFPAPKFDDIIINSASCGINDGEIRVITTDLYDQIFLNGNISLNNIFSHLGQGSYYLEIKNSYGCITDSTVYLLGKNLPVLNSLIIKDAHCNENNGSIEIFSAGSNDKYSLDAVSFQNSNEFSGLAAGNYNFYILNEEGCIKNGGTTIRQTGLPFIDSLVTTDESCSGQNGAVHIYTSGNPVLSYILNGEFNSMLPNFENLNRGIYTVSVIDSFSCQQFAYFTLQNIGEIKELSTIKIQKGNCSSLMSTLVLPQNVEETYSLSGIPVTPDGIYLLEPGTYTVHIENEVCSIDTSIIIQPGICEPFIPNVFSPNDDGINDIFRVEGNGFEVLDFRIFNRWGGVVYSESNNYNGWDGFYKGELAKIGVYTYFIEIQYGELRKVMKGSVMLVR